jgi:nucleotide-binding universal stress UspA family protein
MAEDERTGRRILAALEDQVGATRVLEWTIDEVRHDDNPYVVAAHVVSPTAALMKDFSAEGLTAWRVKLRTEIQSQWVQPLRAAGIAHATRLLEGESVVDGLLELADAQSVDLIVTSAHGHGHLTSGTSNRLLRLAHVPIVVLPPAWHRHGGSSMGEVPSASGATG